jgi:hypothetical protein
MVARTNRFNDVRPLNFWGSAIGLGLVTILASVSVARGNYGFALTVAAITGWPFVLGLLALYLNTSIAVQRWLLLIAAVGGSRHEKGRHRSLPLHGCQYAGADPHVDPSGRPCSA